MAEKSELLAVPAFADLPDDQIAWFLSRSEEMRFKAGETYFRQSDPADAMFVILEGQLQLRGEIGGETAFFNIKPGDVTGVLPFSRMKQFTVAARAVTDVRVLRFPSSLFPELVQKMPELTQRLVGLMSDRIRETTRREQQRDRLASLGKLSAGPRPRTQQSCFRRETRHQPVTRRVETDQGGEPSTGEPRSYGRPEIGN